MIDENNKMHNMPFKCRVRRLIYGISHSAMGLWCLKGVNKKTTACERCVHSVQYACIGPLIKGLEDAMRHIKEGLK